VKPRPEDQPWFHISVVAEMLGIHPQTIRNYERMGLIRPSRTDGNMRLFSLEDVECVRRIQSYTNVGVNLAGVEIIMKLLDQIQQMHDMMEKDMEATCREIFDNIEGLTRPVKASVIESDNDNE
jgi:MerR family transcriptional regulator/heat shock protein HspR